jgi:hypothetical protein
MLVQEARIELLQQQLREVCQQLMDAQLSATASKAACKNHKQRAGALQARCVALDAECAELKAAAHAAAMEAAGTADVAENGSWKEGVHSRDVGLMKYFDRQLTGLLTCSGEAKQQLMALTREVRNVCRPLQIPFRQQGYSNSRLSSWFSMYALSACFYLVYVSHPVCLGTLLAFPA